MAEPTINLKAFEELKGMAGEDFIGELLDTFLEDAPHLIEELHTSLMMQDTDSFRRAAHSLKSNAASFGASHLTSLAREMEMLGKENKLSEVGDQLKVMQEAYDSAARALKGLRS